jgi:hypothetical protein
MQNAILILFAHWCGDYALQTSEMATLKASSVKWLTIHVAVYSIPILAVSFVLFNSQAALVYMAINAGLHWSVDLITSRVAAKYRSNQRAYHLIVGFDQFLHAWCLLGTLSLV